MPVLQEQKPVSFFIPGFLPSTLRVALRAFKFAPGKFFTPFE
jgi:hypothetical protein